MASGKSPIAHHPDAELHVFPNCGHRVMIEQKAARESGAGVPGQKDES
jgi:pimeloyl-ACP methyl ester carboxylesterase